jgi:3-phenylpropionate/trans-cinnamate dioxygenase ferredoxin subunit
MNRHAVCPAAEIPVGGRKIVELAGKSVGIFNVHAKFHAVLNLCPHQRAPLCEGKITGTTTSGAVGDYQWERDGEVLRCPWHGWEFDVTTGQSVFDPEMVRTRIYRTELGPELPSEVSTFRTEIEADWVVVYL